MNRNLAILIAAGLAPFMMGAIAISDKAAQGQAAGTTLTVPFTNNASGNTMIHFGVQGLSATLTNRSAISVVYGTSGNTNATRYIRTDDGSSLQATGWYLMNPPTGSNNVVITFGGSASGSAVGLSSWSGVLQTGQPDSSNAITFLTETVPSITNTCVAANCLLIDNLIKNLTTGTVTPGSGMVNIDNGAVGTGWWGAESYEVPVGSGTNIFYYTFSITSPGTFQIGAFAPAPVTANTQPSLPMTGVGN